MQLLYNSDSFVVVQFDVPPTGNVAARGGYEIVDKFARKEIFIEGAVAESFKLGVQALIDQGNKDHQGMPLAPNIEALDEFIGCFTQLAQQPVLFH
jgi:hypothetical protein